MPKEPYSTKDVPARQDLVRESLEHLTRLAAKRPPLPPELESSTAEILRLAAGGLGLLEGMIVLESRYASENGDEDFELERFRLRRELQALVKGFLDRFVVFQSAARPDRLGRLMSRSLGGTAQETQVAPFITGFRSKSEMAVGDLIAAAYIDDWLYAAAQQRRLSGERRFLATVCSGALALTGLGLALRRRPRHGTFASTAAPEPDLPVLGGKFRIEGELGRGGMGLVYEATDLALHRKVAVKRMREEILRSPKDLEMFLEEARVVAGLSHPHIVGIHGVLREGGGVYLVFEHVAGRPLNQLIVERGRLPLAEAAGLLAQAAAALDYAHSRKIIHRDLKPSNIMVLEDGSAKVMDFGLAHQAKVTVARLTKVSAWGTPAYMAPEQELGQVCRESDLYALGVCLYEMTVGRLPFDGPDGLARKRTPIFAPPSEAGLPSELDAVLRRALDPDPAARYHTAGELAAAAAAVPVA